jgi:homoserine O-succinyltransferase
MPLVIEGRIPARWTDKKRSASAASINSHLATSRCIKLALINNMPDAALEDTELQFFELLDDASGDLPVLLQLYSLSGVPRTDRALPHLNKFYSEVDDLWDSHFDALIMTGTEPRQPDLRQEPYWSALAKVLDWAERHTVSTVLSSLAAHAGVLCSDGIERSRLADKQFGVFEFAKVGDHPLTRRTTNGIRFPHSRWNEVRAEDLTACGYTVLTQSVTAGVDTFIKKKNRSLFVHFQGHPEYSENTLLKEYRRDIKRFLRGERETYPSMPQGYFGEGGSKLLSDFRNHAEVDRTEEVLAKFPEAAAGDLLENKCHASALCLYRNWLHFVESKKAEASGFAAVSESYQPAQRKRFAL